MTGAYGVAELGGYAYLCYVTAADGDPGTALAELPVNILDSLEWVPQLLKLDSRTKVFLPACGLIAYTGVALGSAALTLSAMTASGEPRA